MSDGHVTTESFSLIQDCFCQKFKIWSLFFLHFFIRDFYIWLVMFDGLYFKIFSYSWIGIFWYSLSLSKKNLYRIEIINVSPNTIDLKYVELSKISTTYIPSMVFASRIAKMVRQDLDPQMDWKTSSNYPLQSKQIHDLLQVS